MHVKAVNVKHIRDNILEISFDTGERGTVDFSTYVNRGEVFSRFEDSGYFRKVSIDPE